MMKKLLSFMCCLLPVGAGAVTVDQINGNDPAVGPTPVVPGLNATGETTIVISNAKGITTENGGTVSVDNNMLIGPDNAGSTGGELYVVLDDTNSNFEIQSTGDVSVGKLLSIDAGRALTINIPNTSMDKINAKFGSINANGALTLENINAFKSGAIASGAELSVSAQSINAGAVNVTGGGATLTSGGALTMSQFQMGQGTGNANITATAAITSGNIQNRGENMTISTTGDVSIVDNSATSDTANIGNLDNKGTSLTLNANNVTVAGAVINEAGSMTMNVGSLKVTGGNDTNRSFVNSGNLNLTVAGETNLAYGFDLSAMNNDDSFYLKTGTLKFGEIDAADAGDAWLQVFAKDLKSFYLEIVNGAVTANDIVNGSAGNTAANMTVIGTSVQAASVKNNADTLDMTATNSAGTFNITGGVQSVAGSTTNIKSAGALTVAGNVSNSGNSMVLNGKTVNLAGVANEGASLEILGSTDTSGQINISGTVSNRVGDTTINARQIKIVDDVKNYSGNTIIKGSDANSSNATIGGINVQGGTLALNALVGGVSVTKGVSVTGGALNIGESTHSVTVGDDVQINGDVTLSGTSATGAGNVNIAASGASGFVMSSTNGAITIDGDITANANDAARSARFDAKTVTVSGDVTAANKGALAFGGTTTTAGSTNITGDVVANNGGGVEFYSDDTDVGSFVVNNGLVIAHGSQITANTGVINISGGMRFNGTNTDTTGINVVDTTALTLQTIDTDSDISVTGGIQIAAGNTLKLDSVANATIGGVIESNGVIDVTAAKTATFSNSITNESQLTVNAKDIKMANIGNDGTLSLTASDSLTVGQLDNSSTATINAGTITAAAVESSGNLAMTADSLTVTDAITVTGGTNTLAVERVTAGGDISVSGNMVQGASTTGMLNITKNNAQVSAKNLDVDGAFNALANSAMYELSGNAMIDGAFSVANGASVAMIADGYMTSGALTNAGNLTLGINGADGLEIDGAIENSGNMNLWVNGIVSATSFTENTGIVGLMGRGMTLTGAFGKEDGTSMLYHGTAYTPTAGDFQIRSGTYALTASNVTLAGIEQAANNKLTINTSDITVDGDINATDLRIAANPANDWLTVDVGGNVLGGTQFVGLESMNIGGNYKFDNNSQINAAILPYATTVGPNSTTNNYWSTVSLNEDNTLGKITNASDGAAMVQVSGAFVSTASGFDVAQNGGALSKPQVGLTLFDIVDQGTAIWLLHADGGVSDESPLAKIRNLNVSFCNADGSICFNYLDSLNLNNGSDENLPAYISVRDSDGDGNSDSLYVVFDPRFGGPVQVFKIQPVVGREPDHTKGEYVSAGALDDLIAGQLNKKGFYNRTPIEAIPLIFQKTNMETMANELYERMEYYNLNRDGAGLARFSRLFQVRELEQVAGSIALNEHTNYRSFEDRMFDEFIWNRHRNLKKAWADVDFGMFNQKVSDGKRVDGNRFNISGGFDWQETQTLMLGLTARVSHMSSDNSDSMDLGYLPGQHIAGHVKTKVADTDIGLGGYLMKILGQKTRVYGNGFLDIHLLDVDREQNYVAKISGDGTAFSLTSEWGLLHDWLNQYVVGNMYARVGYNTGFSITEKASGSDYMKLKSDGYFIFTPGYSLTAQKRIYPSAWFQMRPYATIGIEYDVLGAPDHVKYKFASAGNFTSYNVDINSLWANIGGGIEFLSAVGAQFGIDYRYQYNSDIQLHNIRISGSYRF